LALKTKSDVSDIKKVAIWGNHSATQYPDISSTTVRGKPAKDLVDDKWLRENFIPTVQNRGAQIIEARGSSSAASAADAAIKHMNSWVLGSEDWVSMAVPSDGSYGVAKGIYTSYPVICKGDGKYEIVQGLKLDEFSKQKIDASVKELNEEKNAIKDLLKK
jgi:malate dehydrogenase